MIPLRTNRDQSAAFPDHFRAKAALEIADILISIFTLEKAFWGSIPLLTS